MLGLQRPIGEAGVLSMQTLQPCLFILVADSVGTAGRQGSHWHKRYDLAPPQENVRSLEPGRIFAAMVPST